MDIALAAQFDKDISSGVKGIEVRCGFEAEFASVYTQNQIANLLGLFLDNPELSSVSEIPSTHRSTIKWSNSYGASHDSDYVKWSVETDSSIPTTAVHDKQVELVSPVLTLPNMLSGLKSVFSLIRCSAPTTDGKSIGRTAENTGLHLTFSIKDVDATKIDPLKLSLLLGEAYFGSQMGRDNSYYAELTEKKVSTFLKYRDHVVNTTNIRKFADAYLAASLGTPNTDPDDSVTTAAYDLLTELMRNVKYSALNMSKKHKGLIEFRLPGGAGYENKYELTARTAERFAYAFYAASRPEMYKEYYAKKLIRFFSKHIKASASTDVDFSKLTPYLRSFNGKSYLVFTEGTISDKPAVAMAVAEVDGGFLLSEDLSTDHLDQSVSFPSRSDSGLARVELQLDSNKGGGRYSSRNRAGDYDILYASFNSVRFVADRLGKTHPVTNADRGHAILFGDMADVLAFDTNSVTGDIRSILDVKRSDVLNTIESDPNTAYGIVSDTTDFDKLALFLKEAKPVLESKVNDLKPASLKLDILAKDMFDIKAGVKQSYAEIASFVSSAEAEARIKNYVLGSLLPLNGTSPFPSNISGTDASLLSAHYWLVRLIFGNTNRSDLVNLVPLDGINPPLKQFLAGVLPLLPQDILIKAATTVSRYVDTTRNLSTIYGQGGLTLATIILESLPDEHPLPATVTEEDLTGRYTGSAEKRDLFSALVTVLNGSTDAYNVLERCGLAQSRPNFTARILDEISAQQVRHTEIPKYKTVKTPRWVAYLDTKFRAMLSDPNTIERDRQEITKFYIDAYSNGAPVELPAGLDQDTIKKSALASITQMAIMGDARRVMTAGDKVIAILPELKTILFKDIVSHKHALAAGAARETTPEAVAGYVSIGYHTHKEEALGMGSAAFLLHIAGLAPTWKAEQWKTFVTALQDCLGFEFKPGELPACPVFDAIQSITKKVTGKELAPLFVGYTRTTPKAGGPEHAASTFAVVYPELPAPPAPNEPIPYPDNFPKALQLGPTQLAALLGSPTGDDTTAAYNARQRESVTPSQLFLTNLRTYNLEQTVQFISCPPQAGDKFPFATRVAYTLFIPSTQYGQLVPMNTLLAFAQINNPHIVFAYVKAAMDGTNMKSAFAETATANIAASVFGEIVRIGAAQTENAVLLPNGATHKQFYRLLANLIDRGYMTTEILCSKALVAFYKFVVKSGLMQTCSYSDMLGYTYDDNPAVQGKHVALIDALLLDEVRKGNSLSESYLAANNYPVTRA